MDASETRPSLLRSLNRRLKKTGDSEPEQALIRVAIGAMLVLYYCVPWRSGSSFDQIVHSAANQIIISASLIAFSIFAAIIINPRPSPVRRVVGIFFDLTALSIVMYWTGGEHLPGKMQLPE